MYLKPLPSSPMRFAAGTSRSSKNTSLVSWFTMLRMGRAVSPRFNAPRTSTRKMESPSDLRFTSASGVVRARRIMRSVCCSRDPHFLAVHQVAVALADRGGLELGGVGAGSGLGHRHRLQAQFARGDLGQVAPLLRLGAVPEQGPHVVHLPVAGARVPAAAVDLLQDHRRLGEAQPGAAIFLRNQGCEPAALGERADEFLRIGALAVEPLPVRGVEPGAERPHRVADLLIRGVAHRAPSV